MATPTRFRLAIAVCACWVAPSTVHAQSLAQDPDVAEALRLLESWVEVQRMYQEIPAISMAIVHDQELVWSAGFGYADVEEQRPATPETIYSVCSISKLFTSIGVLQLRDEGRLRLADSVAAYLDWFDIERTYPDAPPITIEGLLTHSSGLPRESAFPYWSAPDFDFPTHDQVVARLSEQQTLYPAAKYFQYSNLGFTLAGEVVAAASGEPYANYVRQRILQPLGMLSTTPEIPVQHRGHRLATGYGRRMPGDERMTVPFYQVEGIKPAAGFASTVEDLGLFASWQFRLLESGGDGVLAANTLREMQRVHWVDPDWDTHWGLGFSVWRADDQTFVGHGGSCPGYRSQLLLQMDEKVATIAMANATGVDANLYAQRAYEIVAPAIAAALEDTTATKAASDQDLSRYAGLYRGFWGDARILPWKGGLAMVSMPTDDPLEALSRLEHVEGHTFRRLRDNGEPAELVIFEIGAAGRATRLIRNSNPLVRVP